MIESDIPFVSLTGPEHFAVHNGLAKCYQAMGSKGRFRCHATACVPLKQFAEMDEAGWLEYREMIREMARVRSEDPEWKAKHLDMVRALALDDQWRSGCSERARKQFEDPEQRAKNPACNGSLFTDEWRVNQAEGARKRSGSAGWRDSQVEGARKRLENPEWRANNADMLRSRACNPEWRAKIAKGKVAYYSDPKNRERASEKTRSQFENTEMAAKHAEGVRRRSEDTGWQTNHAEAMRHRFPDVVGINPDGRGYRYAGQSEAARLHGVTLTSIQRRLRLGSPATRVKLRGWSFRYAVPGQDDHIPKAD